MTIATLEKEIAKIDDPELIEEIHQFIRDYNSKKKVSLNGDEFASDQEYFEQIPGFMEKLDKAAAEPWEECMSDEDFKKMSGWDI
jgi:hypothetical protein